jgi:transposase-like protein
MFEDETVDINCPKCGHKNTMAVRDFEESAESHFVCEGCKAAVKVEAEQFHDRLSALRQEVEELEREAEREPRKTRKPTKDDFQI